PITNTTIAKRKNVLLLGSGFVSRPLVDYLAKQKDLKLIIDVVDLDVMNQENLSKIVQGAKQAGITILNEIGVDPGIDHLSAMKIIDDVKAK
ncbi:5179_t:CDS:2, partial [Racocetra fulgida]